jgi:hypothetical protein
MRLDEKLGAVGAAQLLPALEQAMRRAAERKGFHIVHLGLRGTVFHLIVEADNTKQLVTGMQSFGISLARHVNREVGQKRGRKRGGRVVADRYHLEPLVTADAVKAAIATASGRIAGTKPGMLAVQEPKTKLLSHALRRHR